MCGIVGYLGPKPAADVLISGLRSLEYRGYDSAGIALLGDGDLAVERATGKLRTLEDKIAGKRLAGHTGVGHTRWATHGRPSDENAHPHEADGVVVVHNGIIENYRELKERLLKKGRKFRSETDTEVLAHLVSDHMQSGARFADAVRAALNEVQGAYAVVFLSRSDPDQLIAARIASPLIVGLGEGETIVASDIPAILPHTRRILALEEGEFAVLTREGATLTSIRDATPIARAPRVVDWTPAMAERGGYKHFMLKEIHEQPQAISDTLRGRVSADETRVVLDEPQILEAEVERIAVVAMGTSHHAGQVVREYIERLARVPVTVELASEFRYRDPLVPPGTLVIAISQSGETADTLAATKEAKARGARVLAITNVVESSLARAADARLYTRAGVEIGVASTKAYTTQLVAGYLLALALAEKRGTLTPEARREHLRGLKQLPMLCSDLLKDPSAAATMARAFVHAQSALFLGRGYQVATAYEGALKLKELSYIHAEGYAAGEMKHGPIALIDAAFLVVVVGTRDATYDKLLSNVQEVRARDGRVFSIVSAGDTALRELSELALEVPATPPELAAVLAVIPLQLLAYHTACARGHDVDQPRNLAKSVTVE